MDNRMETIIIDGFDFTNMPAMKYWSYSSSTPLQKKKIESKNFVLSGNYIGARKMDGAWNMLIKDLEGNFHLRSRTESVNGGYADKAEWIPHICEELAAVPNGTVLIGEIYFPDNEGSRKITSVLNCLKDKCIERQKKNGYLHYYVFDVLAYKGKNIMGEPFEKRIDHYMSYELLDVLKNDHVEIAEYKSGEDLWELYGEVIAAGGEGIVITKRGAPYQPGKRTAKLTLKLKKELTDTIDAFLDGSYKEPTKMYSGKEIETWTMWYNDKTSENLSLGSHYDEYLAGAPICPVTKPFYNKWASAVSFSVMKDGKPTRIAWISGITDELKAGIINNPDKWVGKVAELTAMMVEHINGEYSLRHGKIECWRPDKTYKDCDFSQITR